MVYLYLLLAFIPFLFFSSFLLLNRSLSIFKISLITLVITILIVTIFWQNSFSVIGFSLVKGFLIALDIFFIIFGAIFFIEVLNKKKIINSLAIHLNNFSPDFRIQVIMLAWFFEGFLEGIAGFGTPSIVVTPLLMALGLSPLKSVVISLLGNSVSVPFGAVGTPIRVGFAGININLMSVGSLSAIYNFVGLLVPIFMLWVLVSANQKRWQLFLKGLPFAIWAGIAFVVPSFMVSLFGFEFPSILGSIIGVILIIITSRFGFLIPKEIYKNLSNNKIVNLTNLKQTIFPYAFFIILLIISKIFLSNLKIEIPFFSYSLSLFNPGFILIFTAIVVAICSKIKLLEIKSITSLAFKKTIEPFLVVAAMSAMVQLMNNSANPNLNLLSITQTISHLFQTKFLPFLTPFVGAFGSFITGSATVSDIMFGSSVYSASLNLNFNPVKILSLLVVGAGAGNMIAIADVLSAKTVAGGNDSLQKVIISLLPFCLIYLFLVALISLF